jgi:hypothetical protein
VRDAARLAARRPGSVAYPSMKCPDRLDVEVGRRSLTSVDFRMHETKQVQCFDDVDPLFTRKLGRDIRCLR